MERWAENVSPRQRLCGKYVMIRVPYETWWDALREIHPEAEVGTAVPARKEEWAVWRSVGGERNACVGSEDLVA